MSSNKSGGGMRVLAFIIIVLLLLAIIGGVIGIGYTSGWFGSGSEEEQQDELLTDEEDNTVITESESNGVSLLMTKIAEEDYEEYGISPLASSAYTLTASTTDGQISSYELDWSIAFADSSSSWASGKMVTDYCTITPTKDGGNVATLTNTTAFGEQIIVTVSSRANSSVSASCTVDYISRLSNTGIRLYTTDTYTGSTFTLVSASKWNYATSSITLTYDGDSFTGFNGSGFVDDVSSFVASLQNITYGDGTITESYTITDWYFEMNDDVSAATNLYGGTCSSLSTTVTSGYTLFYVKSIFEDIFGSSWISSYASNLYKNLQSYYEAGKPVLDFWFTVKGSTTGLTYTSCVSCIVDFSALALSNISLDTTSIVI